jgi:quercetin dioxygenase-like cupin family protein
MAGISSKSFDAPDETRDVGAGRIDVVTLEGATVARMHAEPGWRWSEHVKPIVGGDHCRAQHIGYCLSGSLHVQHEDGTEMDLGSGDAYVIEPGHDAWVSGDQPFEALEFQSQTAEQYARG